jgi:hypothetical protein
VGLLEKDSRLQNKTLSFAFSFDDIGAKEKAWQKEKRRIGVSRSAEREETSAVSTAQAFEKA